MGIDSEAKKYLSENGFKEDKNRQIFYSLMRKKYSAIR